MKKLVIALLASLLVLVGCGSTKELEKKELTITHNLGETEVTTNPEKVVIFDLGVLDMFDALELNVTAVPKSNLSDNLKKYESDDYVNAGTLFEPSFEDLAEHGPDLIIISGRAAKNYDELSKIAPTISLDTDNKDFMESVYNRLDVIAQIFPEAKENIDKEVETLKADIETLKTSAAAVEGETLFLLANGDSISVYGPQSRFGMIYDDFGFKPLSDVTYDDSTHGQQVGFEFIGEHNPQTIVVMDRVVATGQEGVEGKDLLNNDLVNGTDAAKNERVYYVNPFVWYLETGGLNSTKTMISEMTELTK